MRSLTRFATLVFLSPVIALPNSAVSQEASSTNRAGLWFSGGLADGGLQCDACLADGTGIAVPVEVGGSLSSKLLVGGSLIPLSVEDENGAGGTIGFLATGRYYPAAGEDLFLQGGAGLAFVELSGGIDPVFELKPALLLGVGYDIGLVGPVHLTPYLRGGGIPVDGAAGWGELGVTITLY